MKKTCFILIPLLLVLFLFAACGRSGGADATAAHDHAWVAGERIARSPCEGEIPYACSICGATKTESYENHTWGSETRLVTPPADGNDGVCERICSLCGKTGGTVPMTNEEYSAQITELTAKLASFKTADFGGAKVLKTVSDFNAAAAQLATAEGKNFSPYAAPPKTPIAAHPRVLINGGDLDGVRAALADERNKAAASLFFEAIANPTDGELGEKTFHEVGTYYYMNGTYNYDEEVLRGIQALALDYQLTGNEISGYRAILGIENFILSLDVEKFSACGERQYGSIMYTAACVYDWCHDLTTQTDRLRIVSGIEHKIVAGKNMEVGFPPYKQGSVSGHGCEYQILRDYRHRGLRRVPRLVGFRRRTDLSGLRSRPAGVLQSRDGAAGHLALRPPALLVRPVRRLAAQSRRGRTSLRRRGNEAGRADDLLLRAA